MLILIILVPALLPFPSAYAASGQWVKYAGNPIVLPTANSWDGDYVTTPRVLYDGTTFRMWYQGGLSGVSRIGYATSTDGINWVKHGIVLSPGPTGDWDSSSVALGSVTWNGTAYLMWYTGSNGITYTGGAVGFAVSNDGLNWVKYSGNPVLIPSELGNDQRYIVAPYVIRLNLTYNMWYSGKSDAAPNVNKILYATSFDGINWTKWPSPVLAPAANYTAWDSNSVYSPAVFWTGRIFGLWYSGINQTALVPRIGFATSPDGASWTRSSSNPILISGPPGSWDSAGVEQPSVVQVGNNYMMYYDGYNNLQGQRIGLALSPQGFSVAEFPAPAFDMFLGLTACAAICLVYYRRPQKHS
jgi:predicted GH43/DUF377 family glycosyl hydrolase